MESQGEVISVRGIPHPLRNLVLHEDGRRAGLVNWTCGQLCVGINLWPVTKGRVLKPVPVE